MVLLMARPARRKNSSKPYFRVKVPTRIRKLASGRRLTFTLSSEHPAKPPISALATIGSEIKFSLQTSDLALARLRHSEAASQLARHYAALENGPKPLSTRDIEALAGMIYKGFADGGEENPGRPDTWANVIDVNEAAVRGPTLGLGIYSSPEEAHRAERRAALERRFGQMVDALLATQGIITDEQSRGRLILSIARASTQAAQKLKRNAEGDYRPDPDADRFPTWTHPNHRSQRDVAAGRSVAISLWSVFERWQKEANPSPSTRATFKGHLRRCEKFVGHDDLARIDKSDVVRWKDAMVGEGLRSIRSGPLATLKTMCRYAVENGLLQTNPASDITVRQKTRAGESRRAFRTDEVHEILKAAAREKHAAFRWLIWLTALSGARVGEPAQLWADSIRQEDSIWVMHLKPCPQGGTFKNAGSERVVPIHSTLLTQGFLDFVASRQGKPLFYPPRKPGWRLDQKHPTKGITNRAAAWIRRQGFTDPRIGPTHSFRHWFKTEAQRQGHGGALIDALVGHASRSVGDRYYHPDIRTLQKLVESIPIPPDR